MNLMEVEIVLKNALDAYKTACFTEELDFENMVEAILLDMNMNKGN